MIFAGLVGGALGWNVALTSNRWAVTGWGAESRLAANSVERVTRGSVEMRVQKKKRKRLSPNDGAVCALALSCTSVGHVC